MAIPVMMEIFRGFQDARLQEHERERSSQRSQRRQRHDRRRDRARAWHLGFTHAAVSRCGGQLFSEPQHDPGAMHSDAEYDLAPVA